MAGITDEELEVISSDSYMESDLLSAREKTAVLWAEHVTLNTARNRNDVFAQVAEQFTDAEIVELTLVSAFRNMRNRFHDSLGIDLDPPQESKRTGKGSVVTSDNLKAYLQILLDNWPDEFPEAAQE